MWNTGGRGIERHLVFVAQENYHKSACRLHSIKILRKNGNSERERWKRKKHCAEFTLPFTLSKSSATRRDLWLLYGFDTIWSFKWRFRLSLGDTPASFREGGWSNPQGNGVGWLRSYSLRSRLNILDAQFIISPQFSVSIVLYALYAVRGLFGIKWDWFSKTSHPSVQGGLSSLFLQICENLSTTRIQCVGLPGKRLFEKQVTRGHFERDSWVIAGSDPETPMVDYAEVFECMFIINTYFAESQIGIMKIFPLIEIKCRGSKSLGITRCPEFFPQVNHP